VSPPKSSAILAHQLDSREFFGSLVKKVDINVAQSLYGQRCGSDGQNECRGKDAAFVADGKLTVGGEEILEKRFRCQSDRSLTMNSIIRRVFFVCLESHENIGGQKPANLKLVSGIDDEFLISDERGIGQACRFESIPFEINLKIQIFTKKRIDLRRDEHDVSTEPATSLDQERPRVIAFADF